MQQNWKCFFLLGDNYSKVCTTIQYTNDNKNHPQFTSRWWYTAKHTHSSITIITTDATIENFSVAKHMSSSGSVINTANPRRLTVKTYVTIPAFLPALHRFLGNVNFLSWITCHPCSSSVTTITPSITSSLFYSRLKTHMFHFLPTIDPLLPTGLKPDWLHGLLTTLHCFSSSVIFF